MVVAPQILYAEALTRSVPVFGEGESKEEIKVKYCKYWDLIRWDSCPYKKIPDSPLLD